MSGSPHGVRGAPCPERGAIITVASAAAHATLSPHDRCRTRMSLPPTGYGCGSTEAFGQLDRRSPWIGQPGPPEPAPILGVGHIKGYTERFEPPAECLEILHFEPDVVQHAAPGRHGGPRSLAEVQVDAGQIDGVVIRSLSRHTLERPGVPG